MEQQLQNAVWHIHGGQPPASDMVVPFAMLLNLASVAGAEDKAVLWKYLRRYAPEASPETHPGLDAAAGYAVRYFQKHVKPTRVFRAPSEKERAAMEDLVARLKGHEGSHDPEELQTIVYAVGNEHQFQPLRDWFKITHLMLTSKKGMSARQLGRYMGFGSVKTAWLMAHKIRTALIEPETKLGGIVEVDETFVGGRAKNRHADKRDGIPGPTGSGAARRRQAGSGDDVVFSHLQDRHDAAHCRSDGRGQEARARQHRGNDDGTRAGRGDASRGAPA